MFKLDHPALAHARHRRTGRPGAVVDHIAMMVMMVAVLLPMSRAVIVMVMVVFMIVVVAMRLVLALDPGLARAASANRTHQFTSSSLIRNSSPPVTCNRCDPHSGQGS